MVVSPSCPSGHVLNISLTRSLLIICHLSDMPTKACCPIWVDRWTDGVHQYESPCAVWMQLWHWPRNSQTRMTCKDSLGVLASIFRGRAQDALEELFRVPSSPDLQSDTNRPGKVAIRMHCCFSGSAWLFRIKGMGTNNWAWISFLSWNVRSYCIADYVIWSALSVSFTLHQSGM